MSAHSKIEWTDASYTPIRARNIKTGKVGWYCEHATTGCEFCYAEGMNKRLGTGLPFKPGHRKDVELFLDETMLLAPLRWKKPRMIFVCSMTDLFADFVPDEWIDKVFAVMALSPQHTFQVLTKRAARMRAYTGDLRIGRLERAVFSVGGTFPPPAWKWPLPNVWLGVSAERQQEADERIPHLLQTPAAIRFVSAEPLLGLIAFADIAPVFAPTGDQVNWIDSLAGRRYQRKQSPLFDRRAVAEQTFEVLPKLDWIIVGGESGHNARQMHPHWVGSIQYQCEEVGTPFFFKQWGEWVPPPASDCNIADMVRVGKKAAGRMLDGKEHNAMPERVTA